MGELRVASQARGPLERARSLIDRFIPANLLEVPEPTRRARFAVALAGISAGLFVVAAVVQGPWNSRAVFMLNVLSALLCVAAPFVLRRIGRPTLICNAVLALSFAKYLAIAGLLRGPGLSGATVLLAQIPLVATFLMGLRVGAVWAILSMLAGVGIALLGRAGIIVDHLPAADRLFNDHFVLLISTALLFSIAWLYERMKDASQRHIYELEARRQAAELERVQAVSRSQLAEAQRLAALGRIAAATSHEINSPLCAVVANLQLAVEHASTNATADLEAALRGALVAAQRIGVIVADMNRYAEPPDALGTISVSDAISAALKLAQPHTRARARVHQRIDAALPRIVASSPELTQVLLNLVVNAAEAIPEGQIATNEIVVEARGLDGSVIVEVTEPLAVGSAGDGARLGLAMCRAIVEGLGGTLTVATEAGRSCVRLTLVAATARSVALVSAATSFTPNLTILIIDDDETILSTLQRVLTSHTVTVASSGREALAILATQPRFDLIFCDLMMPDLTGMDVFEHLESPDRTLAEGIVFMTGGTFTERAEAFRRAVPNTFLEKPFDLRTLRRVIDARALPR